MWNLKISYWAIDEVSSAIEIGLTHMSLPSDYTNDITRAQFCNLASQLISIYTGKSITEMADEKGNTTISFIDTETKSILACAALGIVKGYGENDFRPGNNITREEAATMLARCARLLGMHDKSDYFSFNDSDAISQWARNNVRFIKANEIMEGDENNNFLPLSSYTVEQSVITFYRLLKKL